MTKPLVDGDVFARTYGDLAEASAQNMNRLLKLNCDLIDGNTDSARKMALELYKDEAERLRIMTMLQYRQLKDAESAAMRLAAVDKRQVQL